MLSEFIIYKRGYNQEIMLAALKQICPDMKSLDEGGKALLEMDDYHSFFIWCKSIPNQGKKQTTAAILYRFLLANGRVKQNYIADYMRSKDTPDMTVEKLEELDIQSDLNFIMFFWREINKGEVLDEKPDIKGIDVNHQTYMVRHKLRDLKIINLVDGWQWSEEFKQQCGDNRVIREVIERWIRGNKVE